MGNNIFEKLTEKYPFISDTVLLNEAVLKTKRYTDILRIFFMRNEFYTFNRDGRNPVIPLTGTHTQIQKQQAKMVTDNIKIILRHCCVLIFILLQLDYILLNLLQINPFYRIL